MKKPYKDPRTNEEKQQDCNDYMTWLTLGGIMEDVEKASQKASYVHKHSHRMIAAAEEWRKKLWKKSVIRHLDISDKVRRSNRERDRSNND